MLGTAAIVPRASTTESREEKIRFRQAAISLTLTMKG
jgi:hypothetical protein